MPSQQSVAQVLTRPALDASSLRNLAGTQVTQSVASPVIVYDTARDTVSSTAAQPAPTNGAAPPGADAAPRVTIVFAPRVAPTPTPNP